MRTIVSVILMLVAAFVGFLLGTAINEAMNGAILLSIITGVACIINAIEKNRKQ